MKIVRDRIPEIMRKNGEEPLFYKAGKDELRRRLLDKIVEEAKELRENPSQEEYADLAEAMEALRHGMGWSADEIEEIRERKRVERGGFSKGIVWMPGDWIERRAMEIVRKAGDIVRSAMGGEYPVNYACIFCQSAEEHEFLASVARKKWEVALETSTGPVFRVSIHTDHGLLELLKIRKPDPKRKEMGDADFTVPNFEEFKSRFLGKPGFSLIRREKYEMVELEGGDVLAYFSHPTLLELLSRGELGRETREARG